MPTVSKKIQLIEDWIEQNMLAGKMGLIRLLCTEDDELSYYRCTIQGRRYKQFGIHRASDGFRVTHLKTGCRVEVAFSSESAARRFVSGITPFTDWMKIKLIDDDTSNLPDDVRTLCLEMKDYCLGKRGPFPNLTEYLRSQLPPDETVEFEPQRTKFGGSKFKAQKPKSWA